MKRKRSKGYGVPVGTFAVLNRSVKVALLKSTTRADLKEVKEVAKWLSG